MYGMIHRGIRAMLVEDLGEQAWAELEQHLRIGPGELVSMAVYEDARTVGILAGAAVRMGLTPEQCLERFGRYWIRFAERGSYGHIMDFTGRDLASFIQNLDRMHQAALAAMPEASVPSFTLVDQAEGSLRVKYHSERSGLEPFVVGLLHGLLDRFGLTGEVQPVPGRGNAAEFVVTYQ